VLDMAGTFTGSGSDQVVDPLPISTFLDSGTSRTTDTKKFAPQTNQVSVSDQVKLETGLANAGTATITGFTVSFDVPEPATLALLPSGLLAVALAIAITGQLRRKRYQ